MPFYTKPADNALVLATAAASPGTGWTVAASVQAAVNQARSSGLPLFIRPGTYPTTEIIVNGSTGGGGAFSMSSLPGSAVLQLTSGNNLLAIAGIASVVIDGIAFDGNNVNFSNASDASALLRLDNCADTKIVNSQFTRSTRSGIHTVNGCTPTIRACRVNSCKFAIWCVDSRAVIDGNWIESCSNNGVMVWTSTVTGNSSSITNNFIGQIGSQSGTGQHGNGISVFRAIAVNIVGNRISGCRYSAIRCNGGGNAIIVGNNCYGSREMAIFIEAPAAGIDLNGAVVSGNVIDEAGNGIAVANSGYGGQGTARSVTISGNRIVNVVRRTINDPGYVPTVSNGFGVYVEGACVVSGNLVENCQGWGVIAGHNGGNDLSVNGNLIINCPVGIGYASHSGAGQMAITGNQIRGASGGSIVWCGFNDATGDVARLAGTTDYGNQYDAQIGNVFIGNNRAY